MHSSGMRTVRLLTGQGDMSAQGGCLLGGVSAQTHPPGPEADTPWNL